MVSNSVASSRTELRIGGLLRQPLAQGGIVFRHLAPIDLVDELRRLDQFGDDLALVLVEQRAVVIDDRLRQLGEAGGRVGEDGELRHRGGGCALAGGEKERGERNQFAHVGGDFIRGACPC
jgi:hypothetical protein